MKMIYEGDPKEKDKESDRETIYKQKTGCVSTTNANENLSDDDKRQENQDFIKNIDLKPTAGQMTVTTLESTSNLSTQRINSTMTKFAERQ